MNDSLFSQCNPPPAETCEEASLFCSLDQMNGYSCKNSSMTPGQCWVMCAGCCPPYPARTWWAFITQGGNTTIKFHVDACIPPPNIPFGGIVWGIWGDCHCNEIVACSPVCIGTDPLPGKNFTYNVNLEPCKIYYLSADACGFSMCDFTITTSGGGPPTLSPLGLINNLATSIIEPVCTGACDYKFIVNPVQGSCPLLDVIYTWTLDGKIVGANSNEIHLDFPKEGDFKLCVTANLDYNQGKGNCAQQGPRCATVVVRNIPDKYGKPRFLCGEDAGIQWFNNTIDTSGLYRQQFDFGNCCKYDSVVRFTILPANTNPTEVFKITCDNKPYIDGMGMQYAPCKNHHYISLPKSTALYHCDSSIRLTLVGIQDSLNWKSVCLGNKVAIDPQFQLINRCNIGEQYDTIRYLWYKKSDNTKTAISKSSFLITDPIDEDYCLDVNIKVKMGADSAICVKTYCDTIQESMAGTIIEHKVFSYCDSAVINGKTYFVSDTFTQQLKSAFGCDSIIKTIISIQKSTLSLLSQSACDSLSVNGITYKLSGDYTQHLQSNTGCDSILNIHATISNSKASSLFLVQCDSAIVNGQTYRSTGTYSQLLKTNAGCDSILSIDLKISNSSNQIMNESACDSFLLNGKVYHQSGVYPQKLFSIDGCDSIVNLNLNISNSSQQTVSLSGCDSVIYNGKTYKQSVNFSDRYSSTNGCDSSINIHINIPGSNATPYKLSSCTLQKSMEQVTINPEITPSISSAPLAAIVC